MKFTILVIFLCIVPAFLPAQVDSPPSRHQLCLSTGIAFDDGLSLLAKTPTLGLGYEYKLGKRWGAAVHMLSYYRSFGLHNSVVQGSAAAADFITPLFGGPFVTETDIAHIRNTGIKKISLANPIKFLSIPVDIGLNFYPIVTERHRLGINGCFSLTYESYSMSRSSKPVVLELEDGTLYQNIFFNSVVQYRHWVSGLGVKLFYEYHWDNMAVGLRGGNYNFFDLGSDHLGRGWTVWESSLYVTAKW